MIGKWLSLFLAGAFVLAFMGASLLFSGFRKGASPNGCCGRCNHTEEKKRPPHVDRKHDQPTASLTE